MPPGWDNWASAVYGNPYSEYGYVLNQNQAYHVYQHRPQDYGTDVYVGLTDRFIRGASREHRPFFAYLSVYAPHQPATPARVDRRKFRQRTRAAHPELQPGRREPHARVRPRPAPVQPRRSRTPSTGCTASGSVRCRRSTAASSRLVHTLRATKQLANTYIVFASDNGFHLGQHRMPAGKQTPYETDIHVPLLVRGPGVRAGAHVTQLAGNTDLAPTFEAMAGVRRALVHRRPIAAPPAARQPARALAHSYLLEHRNETGVTQPARVTPPHGSTLEPPDPDQAGADGQPRHREIRDAMLLNRGAEIPDYDGVRTSRYLYVQYGTGERELYDLRHDPDEIHNLAGTRPKRRTRSSAGRSRSCVAAAVAGVARPRTMRSCSSPLPTAGQRLDTARSRAATMRSLR